MDIAAVTSYGQSIQSIATKEICIFLANDDLTSRSIVVEMLQRCTYEELHVGEATDGLKAIWGRKDKLGLILTNVHRFNVEAFEMLQNIQKQFNLRTILMPPDDAKIVLEDHGSSFTAYFLKCFDVNDFQNLLQSAFVNEKAKGLEESNTTDVPTIDNEATQIHYKRKQQAKEKNKDNEDNEDGHKERKPRVVWTKEMHQKFVRAIEIIGYEKAFPKKILEVMNVPHLKREHIASHLQKYRMRRGQDCSQVGSTYGMAFKSYTKEPCFSSARSALNFNSSRIYSHLSRPRLYGTQFWPVSSPVIPRPAPRHAAFDVHGNLSTFRSNASFSRAMPQKNDHIEVGNLQPIDQDGLMQYSSRYAPYKITLNGNFRVYNDQRKNVLFSFKTGGSSSVDRTPPGSSDSGTDFLGLRLTSDGKIEFGKSGNSSSIDNNDQIRTSEMVFADRIQLQTTLLPLTIEQQNSLSSPENYSVENLVQLPSLLANCKIHDQQELLLPIDHAPDGDISGGSSAMASNFASQQIICSSSNMDSLQYSISDSVPASAQLTCNPQQLNPMLTFGSCEDETTTQCPSMALTPYQDNFMPPSGSPVIDNMVQDPLTYLQCVSGQESPPPLPPLQPELYEINSFGANEDLDVLLNATGSPNTTNIAEMFWDVETDNMLYKATINGD